VPCLRELQKRLALVLRNRLRCGAKTFVHVLTMFDGASHSYLRRVAMSLALTTNNPELEFRYSEHQIIQGLGRAVWVLGLGTEGTCSR
jgi:hypothetical protein